MTKRSMRFGLSGLLLLLGLAAGAAWGAERLSAVHVRWTKDFSTYNRPKAEGWLLSDEGVSAVIDGRPTRVFGDESCGTVGQSFASPGVVRWTRSGEMAGTYYQKADNGSDQLHVARYAKDGRVLFDLPLGPLLYLDCWTGEGANLAVDGDRTWVSLGSAQRERLIALDRSGNETGAVACGPASTCEVLDADASAGTIALKVVDRAATAPYWLRWHDAQGTLERRAALKKDGLAATFDGRGGYYWLTRQPPVDCPGLPEDGALRMVHADARGCTFGPALPSEVALGEHRPRLAVGPTFVFAAVAESLPVWQRRLRGGTGRTPFVRIFRFRLDGSFVDSRWVRAEPLPEDERPLFFGAIDDQQLVMAVGAGGYLRVLGLEY